MRRFAYRRDLYASDTGRWPTVDETPDRIDFERAGREWAADPEDGLVEFEELEFDGFGLVVRDDPRPCRSWAVSVAIRSRRRLGYYAEGATDQIREWRDRREAEREARDKAREISALESRYAPFEERHSLVLPRAITLKAIAHIAGLGGGEVSVSERNEEAARIVQWLKSEQLWGDLDRHDQKFIESGRLPPAVAGLDDLAALDTAAAVLDTDLRKSDAMRPDWEHGYELTNVPFLAAAADFLSVEGRPRMDLPRAEEAAWWLWRAEVEMERRSRGESWTARDQEMLDARLQSARDRRAALRGFEAFGKHVSDLEATELDQLTRIARSRYVALLWAEDPDLSWWEAWADAHGDKWRSWPDFDPGTIPTGDQSDELRSRVRSSNPAAAPRGVPLRPPEPTSR